MLHRELSEKETNEFKQWAIANYTPGDRIDRDLWHPVIVAQCDAMNAAPVYNGD